MGFRKAKQQVLNCLSEGCVIHAARSGKIEEKNLLAAGEVTIEDVIEILSKCRGTEYECDSLHASPEIEVHIVKRTYKHQSWYIKFEPDAVFISVHT